MAPHTENRFRTPNTNNEWDTNSSNNNSNNNSNSNQQKTNQNQDQPATSVTLEQNGKSTIPSDFKGNWDQRGYIAPHTSVDGTNLYQLSEITNEFDFKIRPDFEDIKNNPPVDSFILRVKMY
ncbi:hypothetical protein BGP34_30110 [Bacillus mycoides]|nr:hypothetical protein BGP34_30110 [Bacillus mycoides]